MRKLSQILILIIFFSLGVESIYSQDSQDRLLVVSYNKVLMSDMSKVQQTGDSLFTPILKELVDEGMIYSFGIFNHFWGDEWNFNIWYTVKDMSSFDKFWDEYVNRVNKKHPGAFAAITQYFKEHKDNIYTIENQYPAPQK